jgi:UDP-glucose 4-epimerase
LGGIPLTQELINKNEEAKKILLWKPKFSNINKIFKDEYKWQLSLKDRKFFRKTIY